MPALSSSFWTPRLEPDEAAEAGRDPMLIFVLGGPGCGKGTVCSRLILEMGLIHLSMAEVLLQAADAHPESTTADEIRQCMAQGVLVRDDIVIRLLRNRIYSMPGETFLIDGFPRNMKQALMFEDQIAAPDLVLCLDCPEAVLAERLQAQMQMQTPTEPAHPNARAVISKRLKSFYQDGVPVIERYQSLGLVVRVDGQQSRAEVFAKAKAAVEGLVQTAFDTEA
ncbi:adenylate kinase-domain-containing protein [Polychytrium aggregatum]|uniref:adenylate kinase-domain-containing protein n=1 Tax=Polychytrium aggregatum TaxID=110093 RepID=UPI0022FDF502|nr:adenylate kinase-domain-containing protein [Polychytrium aggregatum]KAI9202278.1 adenylate kinase-domain-containing protein [Polychytrium aggregatum]